ncbi:MAG TPA: DUF2180 family protein [Actinophytocola sp.]|jgi:hypothetical protein|nr:DUF2180 family protein [Actinophytocola sp.]
MHCYDCASNGDTAPAVAVCTHCGAAVCRSCARVGNQTVRHFTGFSSAELALTETRTIACPSCANALATHHAGRYNFAAPTGHVLEAR